MFSAIYPNLMVVKVEGNEDDIEEVFFKSSLHSTHKGLKNPPL